MGGQASKRASKKRRDQGVKVFTHSRDPNSSHGGRSMRLSRLGRGISLLDRKDGGCRGCIAEGRGKKEIP